jgi:uncharacterized membrane protein YbhN (UPF0104 family)
VAGLAVVVLVAGFSVLLSRRLRGFISRILALLPFAPLASIWEKLSDAFNSYRYQYRALAVAFGIALLGIGCTTLVNWCLSQAVGGQMSLPIIMLINPLIALVGMLPISIGGLGLNQAAYPFFYGLAGVPADHAVAVSVLMQAIILLGSLPGGVFWLRGRQKVQS